MSAPRKYDGDKPQWDLLLAHDGAEDVVRVMMHGAEKYGPDNWVRVLDEPETRRALDEGGPGKPSGIIRYANAAIRHARAIIKAAKAGNPKALLDAESGLPHAAHLACCGVFLCSAKMEEAKHEQG